MSLSDRGLTVNGSPVEAESTLVEHKEMNTVDCDITRKHMFLQRKGCLTVASRK
jgi:hypothetical protein